MTSPATGRPLRADALRNRARILQAAEAVFAEQGTSASTEDVARRAGVGIGTVFRHFPAKESLIEAVFTELMRRLADEADALVSAPDPGEALFALLARMVDMSAAKNAYADALAAAGVDMDEALAEGRRELPRVLGILLTRAQEAGAVRPDIGVPELVTLMVGMSRAAETAPPDVRSRTFQVVFDGLRTPVEP
ncbi:TetR/AcrR family transcriptional regulator [Planobispora siamensis]|uniref:TetR family transcriptional regulator n=1 Tax=Planobispora siamensis TaxID=936338 RepID=A0A8J3WJF4_9ACTN|nr:TetR/AcrR family transcriptional regulator [Planobispora siamensis]GIH91460.1 TetR family transcriptional regulator [Planobispora siamensis]